MPPQSAEPPDRPNAKGLADQIFFLPVTPEFVTKLIEKVRPDGLFAAFGGQTALNCAIQLHKDYGRLDGSAVLLFVVVSEIS